MKLIRRHPDRGYYDTWLWLPKKFVSERQISMALLYEGRNREVIRGWMEEPYHFRVPRNFYSPQALRSLPYPVHDTRFKDFPKVDFQSRVILDLKEPDKTYQADGCRSLLSTYDGILCLRCGAGKSPVGLHAAAQIGNPILIIVNEKGLVRQWMDEITIHLGIPEEDIGRIGGKGSPFDWKKKIVVGIINTLANRASDGRLPPEMVRHFGVIIPDEAHLMAAPYFNKGIPPFHGRRWGLSATPTRDDGFDSLLRSTIGEIVYTYLTPNLRAEVFFKRLPTKLDFSDKTIRDLTHDKTREFHFGKTYGYLANHVPARTDTIVQDIKEALNQGRQCLVLTHSRAMCEELGRRFPQGGVIHGGITDGIERLRRIRECNPVIAIMKIGKNALNKPSLDTLFVCEPFRNPNMLQQTMGRIESRGEAGGKKPIVIFYEDVGIQPLYRMCMKVRRSLRHWPKHKGGSIPFRTIK